MLHHLRSRGHWRRRHVCLNHVTVTSVPSANPDPLYWCRVCVDSRTYFYYVRDSIKFWSVSRHLCSNTLMVKSESVLSCLLKVNYIKHSTRNVFKHMYFHIVEACTVIGGYQRLGITCCIYSHSAVSGLTFILHVDIPHKTAL